MNRGKKNGSSSLPEICIRKFSYREIHVFFLLDQRKISSLS
jgi:hypothetical protein